MQYLDKFEAIHIHHRKVLSHGPAKPSVFDLTEDRAEKRIRWVDASTITRNLEDPCIGAILPCIPRIFPLRYYIASSSAIRLRKAENEYIKLMHLSSGTRGP